MIIYCFGNPSTGKTSRARQMPDPFFIIDPRTANRAAHAKTIVADLFDKVSPADAQKVADIARVREQHLVFITCHIDEKKHLSLLADWVILSLDNMDVVLKKPEGKEPVFNWTTNRVDFERLLDIE